MIKIDLDYSRIETRKGEGIEINEDVSPGENINDVKAIFNNHLII